jgi:putative SOS response-associated peptidase YedK
MCGRITLTMPDLDDVAAALEASVSPEDALLYRPRWNGAPTDSLWILEGSRLVPSRWGFPGGMINARAESAARLPAFRDAFAHRRVVVPADGFYEWKGPSGDRPPVWFRPREGRFLYLAGLAAAAPDGRPCFVVLTTEAAGPVKDLHDRMPVLLPREQARTWLARAESSLLVPAPADFLTATEVSTRVNSVANDDAECILPPAPPVPKRQLSFF